MNKTRLQLAFTYPLELIPRIGWDQYYYHSEYRSYSLCFLFLRFTLMIRAKRKEGDDIPF